MSNKQLFVKMALDSWQGQLRAINNLLEKLSEEQLENEVAPGRNRGVYLLGHLTAVHDLMLPLFLFEESLYPELQAVFVDSPDRTVASIPPIAQLKAQWNEVNEKLLSRFNGLPVEEWSARHANISEEDFIQEPHRNRLNVLLGRTVHLSYHRGQLVLLLPKN